MPILYVIIFIPQKSVKNLFLVRQRGFKLAFPDKEGEPLAVDRVDYKQPQAGCMVLGLKSFFFPQGRMVSILPSPKHTKKPLFSERSLFISINGRSRLFLYG
ncbi:hypothetical protein [Dialister hominis]|uniref:hypothetical protein n=1 Tax=Dialister hominis TaxID=2582419 RepID=UPI003AF756F6